MTTDELRPVHRIQVKAVTVKTPPLLPNVKVPVKVKLPPVDDRIRRKVRTHIICVLCGGLLAMLVTFTDGALIHWVPFIPTLPNAFMEMIDRVYDR